MITSTSPADDRLLAEYQETPLDRVKRHIDTAARLQREWEFISLNERAVPMLRIAELLEANRDELATLIADEMGKPLAQGLAEVDKCAWVCRHYAENAKRILADESFEADRSKSYVAYRPLGLVLAVMPWNFPLFQVFRFLAPALMAGNGALLKHASNVTGCALAIDRLVVEAGFPDGLFRTLVLPSNRVDEVLEHPAVAAVSLTGSDPAGRAVGRSSARTRNEAICARLTEARRTQPLKSAE